MKIIKQNQNVIKLTETEKKTKDGKNNNLKVIKEVNYSYLRFTVIGKKIMCRLGESVL